jgi:cyclophilin family peptidyl-prolyl cis-trans isomerase
MKKIILIIWSLIFIILSCSGNPKAVIVTNKGEIVIELDAESAPKHTENFVKLVNERFYIGTLFHRVEKGFVVQGGDPLSKDKDRANDGTGGPGYQIPAEIKLLHKYGTVGAARLPDRINPERKSSGSQFYICLQDLPALDRGGYTVFGKVVEGMDVVERIANVKVDPRNNPLTPVIIKQAFIK